MGEVMETHSKETTNHVKRIAEISRFLLNKAGRDNEEASILYHASPMHDVGKVGIPDIILANPGRLTKEEFQVMKTHAKIGYDILKRSPSVIMQTAAKIALEHHEKWDGTGYPYGLKGEEIHLFSRITSLADVFDSMSHKRVYRDKIDQSKVLDFLRSEKGKHFEPELVNILLDNIDDLNGI